jgi:hypothetical protein
MMKSDRESPRAAIVDAALDHAPLAIDNSDSGVAGMPVSTSTIASGAMIVNAAFDHDSHDASLAAKATWTLIPCPRPAAVQLGSERARDADSGAVNGEFS